MQIEPEEHFEVPFGNFKIFVKFRRFGGFFLEFSLSSLMREGDDIIKVVVTIWGVTLYH